MDSDKRKFILLAIVVISATCVGLIIYFLVFYTFDQKSKNQEATPDITQAELPRISNQRASSTTNDMPNIETNQAPVDLVQQDATQVAKIFVDRYGTYSNQGGQDQFSDLNLFVTSKMKDWLSSNTKELLAGLKNYQTSYIVTTKAVSTKVLEMDKTIGKASIMVYTKRTEQTDNEITKVNNPSIRIDLLKSGRRWQVDGAFWQ